MLLGDKRRQFSEMLPILCMFIQYCGYRYAIDYVKRCDECEVGHKNSTHKYGLAVDIHLYDKDNKYLSSGVEHQVLHDLWDLLGGAPRIENDLNHYSLEWKGVR